MSDFIDITGQRFGRLIAIEKTVSTDKKGMTMWKCKCDCGNIVAVRGRDLRNGNTMSCGCYHSEQVLDDLTGQKFGKLTVLRRDDNKLTKNYKRHWICKCECGNEISVSSTTLKSGKDIPCIPYKNPPGVSALKMLYRNYNRGAIYRNLSFELSLDEFELLTKKNCFYCGAEPSFIAKKLKDTYVYNGVDRVDNKKGYTPENTVSCCGTCNKAKATMSKDTFLSWIVQVYNHSCKENNK